VPLPGSHQAKEIVMTRNVGTWDRILRVVVGLFVLSLVVVGPQTLWGLLGLIPLATGLAGRCGVYSLFGVSTCGPAGHQPHGRPA
jgi:cadmium resistance protein CadD (predicted permease)